MGQPHIWGNLRTYVPLDVILSLCEALVSATVLPSAVSRQPPAARHLGTGKSLISVYVTASKKMTYARLHTVMWNGEEGSKRHSLYAKTEPTEASTLSLLLSLGSSSIAYPVPC